MKLQNRFLLLALGVTLFAASCSKEVLDRPQLTQPVDNNFWRGESDLRLFATGFYTNYFVGYNSAWGVDYTPVRGYTFADDFTSRNIQSSFESNVPGSRTSVAESYSMLTQYSGPLFSFGWVRKANTYLDRITNVARPNLSDEQFNHWSAVARFFRGFEYSRLVRVYGDVPYYDAPFSESDFDLMYKDRDDRGMVMDKVYDDFQYVLSNMRLNDGANILNRYMAASFISRLMLFEGTWLHYHGIDATRAKKYLELAIQASELVMNSGNYSFDSDYKRLFSSESLAGNPEIIMYRDYRDGLVMHHIASYNNGTEGQNGVNLVFLKSYLAADGKVWQNSSVDDADDFSLKTLALTRDPRFEASFIDRPHTPSSTLAYAYKYASRDALNFIGSAYPPAWGSNTNTSDAPVMRLAEVVLNWVEAKAVLAEAFGGAAITQGDLDRSINAIRDRPLDATAIAKGVQKLAPLQLSAIPNDPNRDADVSPLMWEIRRERRVEFVLEHTRLLDIKRWKKIRYMDFSTDPDYFLGPWINLVEDFEIIPPSFKDVLSVRKEDGSVVTYDGTNAAAIVGYYRVENASNRQGFDDRVYLSPVGTNDISNYLDKGYTLSQTPGWQ